MKKYYRRIGIICFFIAGTIIAYLLFIGGMLLKGYPGIPSKLKIKKNSDLEYTGNFICPSGKNFRFISSYPFVIQHVDMKENCVNIFLTQQKKKYYKYHSNFINLIPGEMYKYQLIIHNRLVSAKHSPSLYLKYISFSFFYEFIPFFIELLVLTVIFIFVGNKLYWNENKKGYSPEFVGKKKKKGANIFPPVKEKE